MCSTSSIDLSGSCESPISGSVSESRVACDLDILSTTNGCRRNVSRSSASLQSAPTLIPSTDTAQRGAIAAVYDLKRFVEESISVWIQLLQERRGTVKLVLYWQPFGGPTNDKAGTLTTSNS